MDGISNYLFTQGVLGVVIVGLLLAFGIYYRASEKQKVADSKTIYDLQEARRVDYKDTLKEVTGVMQDSSQNIRILSEKIEVGKELNRRRS